MTVHQIEKVYNNYASCYDKIFGKIFNQGRNDSVNTINKHAKNGAKILEVGVGTGLSLPLYREDLSVTGIDISQEMLKKAEILSKSGKVKAKIDLKVMDAENLEFEDNTFDFVAALYVASVVSDIDKFISEICRVCRPDAHIIFVNHFSSSNKAMQLIENKIAKFQSVVGFKSDFAIDNIIKNKKIELINCYKTNLFGYWKILHCKLSS